MPLTNCRDGVSNLVLLSKAEPSKRLAAGHAPGQHDGLARAVLKTVDVPISSNCQNRRVVLPLNAPRPKASAALLMKSFGCEGYARAGGDIPGHTDTQRDETRRRLLVTVARLLDGRMQV